MFSDAVIDVGVYSYAACAALFALLFLYVLVFRRGRLGGGILLIALAVSALWAGTIAYYAAVERRMPLGIIAAADLARGYAWLALLWRIISGRKQHQTPTILRGLLHGTWILTLSATLVCHLYAVTSGRQGLAQLAFIASGFVIAVVALLLVEQLYRNTPQQGRWTIKFFCLAVGGLFVYDIYLFASGLLLTRLDQTLLLARGAINALTVPFIAVAVARSASFKADQFVSRRMVFYSTSLLAVGMYLLVMAAGGYAVRIYGGTWGNFAQILFLCGALFLLVAVLFSGQARARLKVFVNKHFFDYRYDYREEWLKLTRTLSDSEGETPLGQRAIGAIAALVDSPGGALWVRKESHFAFVEHLNMNQARGIEVVADDEFCRFLREREWIVDLDEMARRAEIYGDLQRPDWLAQLPDAWLVVPLMESDTLLGFVVLSRSRAMREMTWEDHDLLKTVGRQVAGHIALNESVQLLAETRQFQAFNRFTAFIMHDLKNLIAQQSLVVRNAARHKNNPEFIDDAIATVDNSVRRMQRLLEQLRQGGQQGGARMARLRVVAGEVVAQNSQRRPVPTLRVEADGLRVAVDPEGLAMVLGHLVRNAQDATPDDGSVTLVVSRDGDQGIIEIHDNGSGMSPEFVRERLFRPFDTTKGTKGMGIGVYQAREFMREGGGSLEVTSVEGEGSVFRASLPLAPGAPETRTEEAVQAIEGERG